jgi:hypothetical protein
VFGNGIRIGTSGTYVSTTGAAVDAWGPILSGGRDIGQFFGDGVDTVRETVLLGGQVTGDGTLTIEALAQAAGLQSTFGDPTIGGVNQAWTSVPAAAATVSIPDLSSDANAAPYQGTLQLQTQEDASGIIDANGDWVANGKFSLVEVLGLQGYDSPVFTGLTLSGTGFDSNSTATLSASHEFIIDPANDGDINGKVRIKGDFYVDGTTTTINSTSISLSDTVIELGKGDLGNATIPAEGLGIKPGGANTGLFYHGTARGWELSGADFTVLDDFLVGNADGDNFKVTGAGSLSAAGGGHFDGALHVDGATTIDDSLTLSGVFTVKSNGGAGAAQFSVDQSGNVAVSGGLTIAAGSDDEGLAYNSSTYQTTISSVNVEDLTDNRIVIAGLNGELEDDAKFRFDGTSFDIGAANSEKFSVAVSTGATNVSGALTLGGAFTMEGTDGDERATIDTDGNLTVDGNTTLSGDLRVTTDAGIDMFTVDQSTGATNVSGAVLLGSSFTMENPATGKEAAKIGTDGSLTIDGTATLSGDLVVKTDADVEQFSVDQATGNVALSGTLQVKGNSDLDGTLTVQDSIKLSQTVDSNHYTLTDVFAGKSGANGTAATAIDTFTITNLNTVKYIVTIGSGTDKTAIELLAVADGSEVAGTAYGQVDIGDSSQLYDLEVGVDGTNVTLSVSGASNNLDVTIQGTAHYDS